MPKQTVKLGFGAPHFSFCASLTALALALAASPAHAQPSAQIPLQSDKPKADEVSTGTPPDDTALEAGKLPVPAPPPDAGLPQVEPIIPDDEFNRRIPSLDVANDPELDRPLESIEEFERRMASQQPGQQREGQSTETQAAPAGAPTLAEQDEAEIEGIGGTVIRDVELAKPLPPIDQFQVEPVEFAEAAEDSDETQVAYKTQVNGLQDVDKLTETSLSGLFRELSALHDGDGKAYNIAMVTARLREDRLLMQRILASEGWYEAQVTSRVDRSEANGNGKRQHLTAIIDVVPGKRFSLAEINIDAPPTVPPDIIRNSLALRVGEPIVAERVQGAEAKVALTLPQFGYPFAEIGQRDILLDRTTGDGVYTLPVTPGPRARYGGFATEGDLAFDVRHVEVLARFKRGELYDSRMVDDLRQALVATSLFSSVAVVPQRTEEQVGDGTEYVTMMVKQDAGPARTIAGTAGYGTGEGLRAEASWTHRNMFPPEGALIANAVAGTKEQGAGVTFRRSNAGRRDRTFELAAQASHSDYDAYSAYTGRIGVRMSRDSTPIWQKRLTWSVGAEVLATAEKDFDFGAGDRTRKTYYIAALSGQVGLDHTDSLLDPTRGFRVTTLIQPEGSIQDGFNPYVRARADASGYYSVNDRLVLAGRVRLGTIQGAARTDIAPSRRLYSGGGGSVRGYGYQKLGPLDPNGDPIGGRSLNEAAAEVRYRFGTYGVVAFIDAGQSYAETTPQFSDLRYGVGVGVRYYTSFGPVRIDVATPINRRPGENRFNLYVSIGQAF